MAKVIKAAGVKHKIYKKGKSGDVIVDHPTMDNGKWDKINLTKKAGVKTVKEGIASTKKWHKENPYHGNTKMKKNGKGKVTKKS